MRSWICLNSINTHWCLINTAHHIYRKIIKKFRLLEISSTNSIGNALVKDVVPAQSLRKFLSIFGAAACIGGAARFAAEEVALQNLRFLPTDIIGGCLVVIALALLTPLQCGSRRNGLPVPTNS